MKIIKEKKYYIFSFLIPIVIFLIAGTFFHLYPFGDIGVLTIDGASQHPGLGSYFREVLLGNASLFYSFKGGLGYNFYSTAAYYLFSPLHVLSIFFKTENIQYFYALSVLLKFGLCGLSMFTFLKYRTGDKFSSLLLSVCYSLMAYHILYFSNYMWIDGVIMLPLVMLGIEKLLAKESNLYYLITLSASIIFNFYIGYMTCIFAVLYFIYRYVCNNKKDWSLFKEFFVLSFLAGLITSFVTVPVFLDMLTGKGTTFKNAKYFKFNLDFFASMCRFLVGSYRVNDISYGLPNVYTSLLVIVLNISFYFNRKISTKQKIASLVVTLFFFLSFSFNLLDYGWQMFQEPIWFPNRYTFLLSFFLITVASEGAKGFQSMKVEKRKWLICYTLLFAIMIASAWYCKILNNPIQVALGISSLVTLVGYVVIRKKKWMILTVLVVELLANTMYTFKMFAFNHNLNAVEEQNRKIVTDVQHIKDLEKENNDFYRMEFNEQFTHNNGAYFNFNGVTFFSSMRNSQLVNFVEHYLGVYTDKVCRIDYSTDNPFLNAFLGVKYLTSAGENRYYENIYTGRTPYYLNKENLPLAFVVSPDVYDTQLIKNDYLENYDKIMSDVSGLPTGRFKTANLKTVNYKLIQEGNRELFRLQKTGYNKIMYYGKAAESGFLYFKNIKNFKKYDGKFYINGEQIDESKMSSIMYVSKDEKWEIIFEAETTGEMPYELNKSDIDVYFLNEKDYLQFAKTAQDNKMTISQYEKDDYIKGTVEAKGESVLFTTIPFDKGWNVYVDGEKVEIKKIYDTFVALDLKPGEHEIEFKFIPRGLHASLGVILIGIVMSAVYLHKRK